MMKMILITQEELEDMIIRCLSSFNQTPPQEQNAESTSPKYLHSIKELGEFLGCSIVTAQKLKNSGQIRYKQYGRKVVFDTGEVMEDLKRNRKKSSINKN
jgi:hypothetical protein